MRHNLNLKDETIKKCSRELETAQFSVLSYQEKVESVNNLLKEVMRTKDLLEIEKNDLERKVSSLNQQVNELQERFLQEQKEKDLNSADALLELKQKNLDLERELVDLKKTPVKSSTKASST